MSVIKLDHLTKDYGEGRGVFDLNLDIEQGEMMGYVGTNGSGKTTTIRNILGFLRPTKGAAYVHGLEAWTHSSEIVKRIGYVPGEIAFPDLSTGTEFLKSQAGFLGVESMEYANLLIERLQLDPRAPLKRMSKGMKQKTAIVAALMANPEILVLDEPYKADSTDEELKEYLRLLSDKGPQVVIITSVPVHDEPHKTSVYAYNRQGNRYWKVTCPYLPAHYPGTGDTFTSVITGSLMQGDSLPMALDRATQFILQGIRATFGYEYDNREGILLEKVLHNLDMPIQMASYELI